MRVLCIDVSLVSSIGMNISITIGRYYDVLGGSDIGSSNYYVLVDDNGFVGIFLKSNFKTMDQVRDERLNELGVVCNTLSERV